MEDYNTTNSTNYFNPRHVHEIVGSTLVERKRNECHNHRFCTVSGEAIREGRSHVHEVKFRTDFTDGHCHEFCGKSSPAIYVGGGKHIHFAKALTETADGHRHLFQVASLIDSPLDTCRDENWDWDRDRDCDRDRDRDCDCDCDHSC